MNYTPKTIKRTLKKCITEISAHPEMFAKNPEKDFKRTRKLPFEKVLKTILFMSGKSRRGELMDYFGLTSSMPTVSAFVQQRRKINYHAFVDFSHLYKKYCCEKSYNLISAERKNRNALMDRPRKEVFYVRCGVTP